MLVSAGRLASRSLSSDPALGSALLLSPFDNRRSSDSVSAPRTTYIASSAIQNRLRSSAAAWMWLATASANKTDAPNRVARPRISETAASQYTELRSAVDWRVGTGMG